MRPKHFDQSLEAHNMKREPGPLNEEDREEIAAFQMANDCEVDRIIGRQTKDALWAALARAKAHSFSVSSFFIGGLVVGFIALMF